MTTEIPGLETKLLYLLHRALVDVRNLSTAGHLEQVAELADVFEWLPSQMGSGDIIDLDAFRADLRAYQDSYGERAHDYLSVLDMDEGDFCRLYERW